MSDAAFVAAVRAETFDVPSGAAYATSLDTAKIDDLIEKSSFGTEGARRLRNSTSPERAAVIVEGAFTAEPAPGSATEPVKRGRQRRQTATSPGTVLNGEVLDPIVRAAGDGNPGAVQDLLHMVAPLVVRYCRARLAGHDQTFLAADDVAQEVCLALLKVLPTYQARGGSFLRLVHTISARKVADALRVIAHDRSEPVSELPEQATSDNGPEAQALSRELTARMGKLVSVLPRSQQEVIALRISVGLSAAETAEALGLTAGAVRVAQHRALTQLRSMTDGDF